MDTTSERSLEIKTEINAHEQELKGLLSRVMGAPLAPIQEKIQGIRQQMDELEKVCSSMQDTGEQAASLVGDIHKERDKLKSTLQRIEQSIGTTAAGLSKLATDLESTQTDAQERLIRLEELLTSQRSQLASQHVVIESALAHLESQYTKGLNDVFQQQQLLSDVSQKHINAVTAQLAQSMHAEMNQAMQGIQRRMIWLIGVCGLSLVGTIGVLVHLFA